MDIGTAIVISVGIIAAGCVVIVVVTINNIKRWMQ